MKFVVVRIGYRIVENLEVPVEQLHCSVMKKDGEDALPESQRALLTIVAVVIDIAQTCSSAYQ